MSRWPDRLGTGQLAFLWGVALFVPVFGIGVLLQWLEKGHIDLGFLIPYALVFTVATGIPATIRQRSRR